MCSASSVPLWSVAHSEKPHTNNRSTILKEKAERSISDAFLAC